MAYDFNGIFSPSHIIGSQQQQPPPQHQSIWQHQKFQPMSSSENFSGNAPFLTGLGVLSQFQGANNAQMIPSLTPQVHSGVSDPQKADTIQGFGVLTWLSAKAGLITCRDNMIISFQLKDFCDQMLNDLTSVLRVGFTLSFFASLNETNEYTATIVQPVYGPDAELLFANTQEVDLRR
uniref:Uncharacterized protein n=1 Tax=Caenorhabditis japonica TaxID=281687 RepID=A0A8R1ETF3_CAEJA